jgi:UDP-glucose 4-epimerase
VYGEGPTFREEDTSGIGPSSKTRWAYSCSKLLTEFMLAVSGCPYTIVRFFNVVGAGQLSDYGMVLPRFVEAALKGDPLTVYGDGSAVRAFCHVDDAIDALTKVSDIHGEVFNIGNSSEPVTMLELATQVVKVTGSSSNIVLIPYNVAFSNKFEEIMYRVPDLTKLNSAIDYEPKYDLESIIKSMSL